MCVLGPVTGNQLLRIRCVGATSAQGTVTVRFSTAKHTADSIGEVHCSILDCDDNFVARDGRYSSRR